MEAPALLDDEVAKLLQRLQVGRGRQIDLHHLALGGAEPGDVVVAGQRGRYVGCGQPVGGKLDRIEPGAQREGLVAEQLRGLHAGYGLQLGLHHADQVVGDLVRRQHVAAEAEIHGVDGLADLDRQHRLLDAARQLIEHRVHLGVDLGQRLAGVEVQPQVDGDGGGAGLAGRRHVVDAIGLGDGVFQRRGDEPGNDRRIGAVVRRRHGDDRVLGSRILQDRQRGHRLQTQHQDHQADDDRKHRPANEDVGKGHVLVPH
ncbi:hypothetical protein ABIF57_002789 [Bradyrhizobium diazoefficiens]